MEWIGYRSKSNQWCNQQYCIPIVKDEFTFVKKLLADAAEWGLFHAAPKTINHFQITAALLIFLQHGEEVFEAFGNLPGEFH